MGIVAGLLEGLCGSTKEIYGFHSGFVWVSYGLRRGRASICRVLKDGAGPSIAWLRSVGVFGLDFRSLMA